MSASISGRARELLEEPNFGYIATIRADGTPHVAIVWVDLDGDEIVVNSAQGRAWPTNLQRDPRMTLTVANRENQYEYVSIRGRLREASTEGAEAQIDQLTMKYMGKDTYPFRQEGEVRLKFHIEPEKVLHQGG